MKRRTNAYSISDSAGRTIVKRLRGREERGGGVVLRAAVAGTIAVSYYSAVRLNGVSIFDILSAIAIATLVLFIRKTKWLKYFCGIFLPIVSLQILASFLSALGADDVTSHLVKSFSLVAAYVLVLLFCAVVVCAGILSYAHILQAIAYGGALCCFVVVLQGRYGVLTQLLTVDHVYYWTRMTGFAEHPIEAGYIASYSVVAALTLIVLKGMAVAPTLALIVSIYSMYYSASFTSYAGLICALVILFLFSDKKILYMLLLASIAFLWGAIGGVIEGSFLHERLSNLFYSFVYYDTVESRLTQLDIVFRSVSAAPWKLIFGFGYDNGALPDGLEIHNGIIASIYHFGLTGVFATLSLIGFMFVSIIKEKNSDIKGALLAFVAIFLATYLTGPGFMRRSLWVTPLFLSFYSYYNFTSRR